VLRGKEKQILVMDASGIQSFRTPEFSSPHAFVVGDKRDEAEMSGTAHGATQGGVLLFCNEKIFCIEKGMAYEQTRGGAQPAIR
jgi:hypothetical protein